MRENVLYTVRLYIENNNGWTQERKIKYKTESDVKISFRCFFDRTRCVREIRMVKKVLAFSRLAVVLPHQKNNIG